MGRQGSRDSAFWDVRRTLASASRQPDLRAALEAIARGVTEVVGFQIASIARLRPDHDYEVVAVVGNEEARSALVGVRWSREVMAAELARGEEWGLLRFLRGSDPGADGVPYWLPEIDATGDPEAWQPEDALIAPLLDGQGEVIGILSVDLPEDGRVPDADRRRLLEDYALEASGALINAEARAELAERIRLSEATREIMRFATADMSLERIVADCKPVLSAAFDSHGIWIQTYVDGGPGALHGESGDLEVPDHVTRVARRHAEIQWHQQSVVAVSRTSGPPPGVSVEEFAPVLSFVEELGVASFLFIPLGAGPETLGHLAMSRLDPARPWTVAEQAAARDVGRDLGRVILNTRLFAAEQESVAQLERLHQYRSRLIATMAHELKTPLTVLHAHVELLEDDPHPHAAARDSLATIGRASERLQALATDLLTLSEVSDTASRAPAEPVDLRRVVEEVIAMLAVETNRKGLTVVLRAPADDQPVLAWGAPEEFHRVCSNLFSNAVKYTPTGGRVTLVLERAPGEVRFRVGDEGIGISADDQVQLFQEFFRSSNPEALALPGSGLGLTIVQRIVERRGGQIRVASQLGEGSTFSVSLPAPREG